LRSCDNLDYWGQDYVQKDKDLLKTAPTTCGTAVPWGNLTNPFDSAMGNGKKYAVLFRTRRTVFDLWQNNPRPAVSFRPDDIITSAEIYSDESCSNPMPMTEEVNPFKLLSDLNWGARNANGPESETPNSPFLVDVGYGKITVQ
jgi:hypothetical protein